MEKPTRVQLHDGRYQDRTNFSSAEYLHINSCGVSRYQWTDGAPVLRTYRPDGRVDMHLLLVSAGEWRAVCGGANETLRTGEGIFYLSGEPQDYAPALSAAQPECESRWLHFCGRAAPTALAHAGFTQSGVLTMQSDAVRAFDAMLRAQLSGDALTACGNLLRLLAQLRPGRTVPVQVPRATLRAIEAERTYIGVHYAEEIDFDACAARCCLSRSRFAHLFTRAAGMPPAQYQLRLRLNQAQELLSGSALTVSEVAAQVGYADALYFSRLFRRKTGVSPSQYRAGG